jgi:hypothetical protein
LKIGVDLDGTLVRIRIINPNIKLPSFLFILLIPFVMLAKPNEKIAGELRSLKKGGFGLIIISARPAWSRALTCWWLKRYQILFDEIFLVGFGKESADRKLKIIMSQKIDLAFDDDCRVQDLFGSNSIEVIGK